jgi:two-component system, LytTR family, sensor kinase
MNKSVKVILHAFFWILFPLVNAFSKWADAYDVIPGFESLPKPGFFQIITSQFRSLFIPMDVGRQITDISNLIGIVFNLFIYIIIPIGVFYLFYGSLIPKILRDRSIRNKILPIFFVLIFPFLIPAIFRFFTIAVAWKFTYCVTIAYIITIVFAILGSFFRILENWIITEKIARQNLQSELALLKNQISPHFLFNTLNNIDSLIKSSTDMASETLIKLSDILRYMIYDTNVDKVLLANEIKYMESYIDLQKLQFANKELVKLSIIGNPGTISISPMIFIPFIENAFKHCTNKDMRNAIRITFSIENNIVNFECINDFDKSQEITKDNASGIGLNNIKRRLEILYPGMHSLNIKEERNIYSVILSVNTNEY